MSWKIYPISEFEKQQEGWQRLNRDGIASPLLDPAFMSPLLQYFGTGKEILVCYECDGQAKAMAIMVPSRHGAWETFQPSQAPVGAWLHSADMDWNILLYKLMRVLPGFPLLIGVTQQDPDLVMRPEPGNTLKTLDYIQTARISLNGDFDSYWNSRGKNLRQNMKKQRSKLAKDAITTRLELSTSPEDVAQAITDYGIIESAGWKADGGTAISPATAQGQFYRAMMENFCRVGSGHIYRYWYDDRIVAMDLCIEGNENIVILKTTYDESIKNGTSPALLMRQDEFKKMFSDGELKKIEFYGRVMDWHTKWSDEIRTLYHVNQYRWHILSKFRNSSKKSSAKLQEALI
jgi:CelD/BcsL family acetyltransferase involved in cellulose biosynthesis